MTTDEQMTNDDTSPLPQRIGLNLLPCIRDIVDGTVPLEQVKKLIISHLCPTDEEWTRTIDDACVRYWSNLDPDRVREVIGYLRTHNLIEQPRLKDNNRFPIIKHFHTDPSTHWVSDERDIVWN